MVSTAQSPEHTLTLVDLQNEPQTVYLLGELDAGSAADGSNTVLRGYLLFACYRPIPDNHRFKLLIDSALRIGMDGRVMGNFQRLCRLTALNIRRRLTAEEKGQYGDGIEALVRVEYIVSQDPEEVRPLAIMRDAGRITCVNTPDKTDVLQSSPKQSEVEH